MFKKLYQMAMAGDMDAVLQLAQASVYGAWINAHLPGEMVSDRVLTTPYNLTYLGQLAQGNRVYIEDLDLVVTG